MAYRLERREVPVLIHISTAAPARLEVNGLDVTELVTHRLLTNGCPETAVLKLELLTAIAIAVTHGDDHA